MLTLEDGLLRGFCLVCLQVYQQVAQWRHRMHALLKAACCRILGCCVGSVLSEELLDVAPKPQA